MKVWNPLFYTLFFVSTEQSAEAVARAIGINAPGFFFFFFPFGIIISFPNNFWGQIILFLSFLFFYFYFYLNFSLSISLVSELSKCTIDLSKLQYFNFIHAVYVRVKFDRKRLHIHDTWLLHPLSKTHHQSNST